MNAIAVCLPRIVRFLGTDDCEGASCPHCGATGRYIHRFRVDDGRTLAAMSGCVKLFPVSRVAIEEQRLLKKLSDYKNRGWRSLNQRDTEALAAIYSFYEIGGDERHVLRIIDNAKLANIMRRRR